MNQSDRVKLVRPKLGNSKRDRDSNQKNLRDSHKSNTCSDFNFLQIIVVVVLVFTVIGLSVWYSRRIHTLESRHSRLIIGRTQSSGMIDRSTLNSRVDVTTAAEIQTEIDNLLTVVTTLSGETVIQTDIIAAQQQQINELQMLLGTMGVPFIPVGSYTNYDRLTPGGLATSYGSPEITQSLVSLGTNTGGEVRSFILNEPGFSISGNVSILPEAVNFINAVDSPIGDQTFWGLRIPEGFWQVCYTVDAIGQAFGNNANFLVDGYVFRDSDFDFDTTFDFENSAVKTTTIKAGMIGARVGQMVFGINNRNIQMTSFSINSSNNTVLSMTGAHNNGGSATFYQVSIHIMKVG